MSGRISGLQQRILELNPLAPYVHCLMHSINLAVQDAIGDVPQARDTLNMVKDVINFIRSSPKRETQFEMQMADTNTSGSRSLKPLCPTRFTVRVQAVKSVVDNYQCLLEFFANDVMWLQAGHDAATKARGFERWLGQTETLLMMQLLIIVLGPVEELATVLQSPTISIQQAIRLSENMISRLKDHRDEMYNDAKLLIQPLATRLNLSELSMPRRRVPPRRIDNGAPPATLTVDEYWRNICYAVMDTTINTVANRIHQHVLEVYAQAEHLLEECYTGISLGNILQKLDDLFVALPALAAEADKELLASQLRSLRSLAGDRPFSMQELISFLSSLSHPIMGELRVLIRLLLLLPVTTATVERSFSAMKRVKTYIRSTMSSIRLNSLALLHAHKERTMELDIDKLVEEFGSSNEIRRLIL
jgi:hypothetical protein